jgi:glycosyltransferase involved in cell wall biosynthesis
MLGPSLCATKGGISAVINVYRAQGVFEHWPIRYISTHRDGTRLIKFAQMLTAFRQDIAALALSRISLVHVHASHGSSFWRKLILMLPALLMGKPIIFHLHGSEFQLFAEQRCGPLARSIVRFALRKSARVIALSPQWKTWLENFAPGCRVQVIRNLVVMPPVPSSRPREVHTLLFLGRLGERKGIYALLEAIALLHPRFPNLRLLAGGDGELERVAARAKALGIAKAVEILGWVTGERKNKLLAEATIYVLPSHNEGLPMSVLEAMSWSLPVVTTPVGGIPEAVTHGVEGFLVQPGDVVNLAEAINKLLIDPGLRERMGIAARARVERQFAAEVIIPQLEALYRELGAQPRLLVPTRAEDG